VIVVVAVEKGRDTQNRTETSFGVLRPLPPRLIGYYIYIYIHVRVCVCFFCLFFLHVACSALFSG
jgi:hypothetical protein